MRKLGTILAWPFLAYYRFLHSGGGLGTHVKILPFGSGFTTYVLAKFVCGGEWLFWQDWDAMLQAASLGLIGYSFSMATLEVAIMVGILATEYIIKRHKRIREEGRKEGRVEGRKEGRVEGRKEGRVEGREEGREVERKEWQAWYERQVASGVALPEPPPMANGTHPEDVDAG